MAFLTIIIWKFFAVEIPVPVVSCKSRNYLYLLAGLLSEFSKPNELPSFSSKSSTVPPVWGAVAFGVLELFSFKSSEARNSRATFSPASVREYLVGKSLQKSK